LPTNISWIHDQLISPDIQLSIVLHAEWADKYLNFHELCVQSLRHQDPKYFLGVKLEPSMVLVPVVRLFSYLLLANLHSLEKFTTKVFQTDQEAMLGMDDEGREPSTSEL
jgi:hypothetical protein